MRFCFIVLIALTCTFIRSNLVASYSLRKFGVNFEMEPDLKKKKEEMFERSRQEKEQRERINQEKEIQRMKIIHKYLLPLGGKTSLLMDLYSRL